MMHLGDIETTLRIATARHQEEIRRAAVARSLQRPHMRGRAAKILRTLANRLDGTSPPAAPVDLRRLTRPGGDA